MHTVACKRIEKYRQCGNKSLSFTCCHFCDFTLMKHGTAEQLHIIVHHVPLHVVAAGNPMIAVYGVLALNAYKIFCYCQLPVEVVCSNDNLFVFRKPTCRFFYNAESKGHNLVKSLFVFFKNLFLKFVYLIEYFFTLVNWSIFYLCFKFVYLSLLFLCRVLYVHLYLFCTCSEGVVVECFYFRICYFNFFN